MWVRIIEFMLAVWLALSPFILSYPSEEIALWVNDYVSAFFVALFALLSFYDPLRHIHLLTLGVAFWLWSFGYSSFPEIGIPSQENSVVIGLLLLMLAIIPSHSHLPSRPWQEFIKRK